MADLRVPPFGAAEVNAMVRERFPGADTDCRELGAGYAIASYTTTPGDVRPGGFESGPTQFALVDSACGS